MSTLLTSLPLLPGIYLFKNRENVIIYIGKAKSIRKRVSSYFKKRESDWKIKSLLEEHASIDFIITNTETEALLLEAQLIKEYQPKFNVLLKSGQPFVYLLFTQGDFPSLELVRNKKKKGIYFGPFLYKRQARAVHEYLIKTFKLSSCNKKIAGGCLQYHMNLCAGTCMDQFDIDAYKSRLLLAKHALEGNHKEFLKQLHEQITAYNKSFAFEKAQKLTYYVQNFDAIFDTLKAKFSEKKYEKDVILATAHLKRYQKPDYQIGDQLAQLLQIPHYIETVDCFDISHFQSSSIVGSCIRFTNGAPDKNNFRRFAIKTLTQQNDYAALQEIVMRRYRNSPLPDLIVIDGGKGQRNAVLQVLPHANIVSLAKKEERLFSDQFAEGHVLDPKSDVGLFFIA